MVLVPRRDYLILILGDAAVFVASLWVTLALRYVSIPAADLLLLHAVPFVMLFLAWFVIFFLAGLYGKQTHLFRSRLLPTILYSQTINVVLAALFFFVIPSFGITPKTVLVLYLIVSSLGIFAWRIWFFPLLRPAHSRLRGILIASGPDAKALAEEIGQGGYPFMFECVIDTKHTPSHEVIQQACRIAEEDELSFLVVDFSDASFNAALPIVYDTAFQKRRFAIIDVTSLYEEVFERAPLSFVTYEWVLENLTTSRVYDGVKRLVDIVCALIFGIVSLIVYPFVALAIKLEDRGSVFITQERVGKYQKPIYITKFRSMSGNDSGSDVLKSKNVITRVGAVLRRLRIDELPQIWSVLKGDLSFVGPRPELPALAAHYSARIPYYNARYLMTPGLTGWAQVLHDRHPHHGTDVLETKEKLSYDLYYLRHRSLLTDLYVFLQTVRIVLTAKGS